MAALGVFTGCLCRATLAVTQLPRTIMSSE